MKKYTGTREDAIEVIARILCLIYGFEPVDSADGSQNWWMFRNDAVKLMDDLAARGFTPVPVPEPPENKSE